MMMMSEHKRRIATIAESMVDRYGDNAIAVAEQQEMLTTGDLSKTWHDVIAHLDRPGNQITNVIQA